MAPQLWMLRHGEAVPHDSKPDAERELTPRGRRQAQAAGAALAAVNEEFVACYASPKVRAWETAELACAHLNVEPVAEDSLANGFSRVDALALLEAHGADAKVLVVGHEPSSRRSSTTSRVPAWTSRRAGSPDCARRAAPVSCSCSSARRSSRRSLQR